MPGKARSWGHYQNQACTWLIMLCNVMYVCYVLIMFAFSHQSITIVLLKIVEFCLDCAYYLIKLHFNYSFDAASHGRISFKRLRLWKVRTFLKFTFKIFANLDKQVSGTLLDWLHLIKKKNGHLVSPCYQFLSTADLEEKLGFDVWRTRVGGNICFLTDAFCSWKLL